MPKRKLPEPTTVMNVNTMNITNYFASVPGATPAPVPGPERWFPKDEVARPTRVMPGTAELKAMCTSHAGHCPVGFLVKGLQSIARFAPRPPDLRG
jgi:hypothetical protein